MKIDFQNPDLEKYSTSMLKKVADYWLRQYLLSKTKSKNGRFLCPLKNKWYNEKQMNVAHFIDRGKIWTRYDLKNCHLISETSNQWDSKIPSEGFKSLHHKEYEIHLKDLYGSQIIEELRNMSENKNPFPKSKYIELIKKFMSCE